MSYEYRKELGGLTELMVDGDISSSVYACARLELYVGYWGRGRLPTELMVYYCTHYLGEEVSRRRSKQIGGVLYSISARALMYYLCLHSDRAWWTSDTAQRRPAGCKRDDEGRVTEVWCKVCESYLHVQLFTKRRELKTGYMSRCRQCEKDRVYLSSKVSY